MGDTAITVKEFQARAPTIAKAARDELFRATTDIDKRMVLIRSLLREESAAREARRLGYDRHPAVVAEMIERMLTDKVAAEDTGAVVSTEDLARYFADHRDDLGRPALVRALQIVTTDKTSAERLCSEARAREASDLDGFAALAGKHSTDAVSRVLGGDMGFFDVQTTRFPAPVVRAAFALAKPHDVSDPIPSPKGFHVVKLVQQLPAYQPSFAEAEATMRSKLRWLLLERKKNALRQVLYHRADADIDYSLLTTLPLPPNLWTAPTAADSSPN
jgi:parvulin-like peptidyl-prolyl isomerase